MTVHRVGETAENQQKTREKSKVAENQVFWLDFCAKKRTVHTLSEGIQEKLPKFCQFHRRLSGGKTGHSVSVFMDKIVKNKTT
jgi:hypothetical protein